MINHDAADSSTQKGSAGGMGQIAGGRESGSTGAFLGPPGRIGMITGAPSPHQVLSSTTKFASDFIDKSCLKLSCHIPFTYAFTALGCIFLVITWI